MKTYAAYYDNPIRIDSSSGGVFSLIASHFDVVYGVSMSLDCYEAKYERVETDLSKIRGSKYIQAHVGDTFKHVKSDLDKGKKVLFSGTGCQINGLKLFLRKDYDNLFLLDVVCHGVPSPKLWKKHVLYMENMYGKLEKVSFRKKYINYKYFFKRKFNKYVFKEEDAYMQFFLNDLSLRPSCYQCHAKKFKCSDMTIADFWGIVRVAPSINDGLGTSLIISRTNKGNIVFDQIKDKIKWEEVSYKKAIRDNVAEYKSTKKPDAREKFFEDMASLTIPDLQNKYIPKENVPFIMKLKILIKRPLIKYSSWKGRSIADYAMFYVFKKK